MPPLLPGLSVEAIITAVFDWLAVALGAAAVWVVEALWDTLHATTLVDLTSPGYVAVYNSVFGIGVFVMLTLFCGQLIVAMLRRNPAALGVAVTGMARGVLGSFLALTLLTVALEITDQLTLALVAAAGTTLDELGVRVAGTLLILTVTSTSPTNPGVIITMVLAGLTIGGAMAVWCSLLVRKALLLITAVLAPIAFAGQAATGTRAWTTRWLSAVIALVVSKLVIVLVFLIGVTTAAADGTPGSAADALAGVVMLFIAAFAPVLCHRFLAFTGIDQTPGGAGREVAGALRGPLPAGLATTVAWRGLSPRPPAAPGAVPRRPAAPVTTTPGASR